MLQCLQTHGQPALRKRWKHTGRSLEDLTNWIEAKSKTHYVLDVISVSRLNTLFGILPTRGRKEAKQLEKLASQAPKIGRKLPVGHHLGILPDKYANSLLRPDGTSPWHAPPSPFNRKQWLGGSFIVSEKSPPSVGINFLMKGIYLDSKRIKEDRDGEEVARTVEVRQRLILSQWYPSKTDLVIEDRVTGYSSERYDPSSINTTSVVPPKTGTFSFAFTPTPSMLRAFANLSEDTHRIHVDLAYAKSEGYPELVVQVPLQLIVMLDVMVACLPDELSFRAVDYRVINPLFSGRRIKVYRQWIHGLDKDDDSPVTLDDFIAHTMPPKFQLHPEEVSKDAEENPPQPHFRRQGRHANLKRMALFWTAMEDGTVGTVALVVLVPRPRKVFWKLDNKGYLLHKGDLESSGPRPQDLDDGNEKDHSIARKDLEGDHEASAEPYPRFDERPGFDSLGRPIADRAVSAQESSTYQSQDSGHPWSLQDADEAALEKERLERIKKAEALVKSRDLLRRMFDDEGGGCTI